MSELRKPEATDEPDKASTPPAEQSLNLLDALGPPAPGLLNAEGLTAGRLLDAPDSVNQLARLYLLEPEQTRRAVDRMIVAEQTARDNILSDAGAVVVGLGTKYGVGKILARGPVWVRPVGLLMGAGAAGLSKDYLNDGQLGTGTDWLRGAGVYGGSLLLLKGMSLNPSRAALTTTSLEAISARTGVQGLSGTSAQVADRLIAGGAAGSSIGRTAQYFNPLNYTGLSWNNGLHLVGFGGQRSAAALAEGSISAASFNARRNIAQFGSRFGGAYAFGATREAAYIATGEPSADGTTYSIGSAMMDINASGVKFGLIGSLLAPAAGGALRLTPGVNRVMDRGVTLASRFGPGGSLASEGLAPVAIVAGARAREHQGTAARVEALSQHARSLLDTARQYEIQHGR